MKILLTGGSGYLGTSLKQELRNRGNRVFSLSRSSGPHIDDLACDLTDMSEIDDIFKKLNGEKIKVVVHLASKLMDETSSQFDIFDHNLEISKGFPKKNEVLTYLNYVFTIEAFENKRIKQIKLSILPKDL